MKSGHEILSTLEELFTGWSFDVRYILYALSRCPELPKNIEADARALSQLVVKTEALNIFRIALHNLTTREYRLNTQQVKDDAKPQQPFTFAPTISASEATAIPALIEEIRRLEGELSKVNVDYVAILKFLREKLA